VHWHGRFGSVGEMQDEQLAGFPVAGMEQIQDEKLTGTPAAELMAQMRDEQPAGTRVAGLMEQIQGEQLAGDLAAGLAGSGSGAPSRAHQSFSQCKMTQCPNPNPARS
jgi:hypothetical protein